MQAETHEQLPKQTVRRPRTRAYSCNDETQNPESGCEYSGSEDDQFFSPVLENTLDFETRVIVSPEQLPYPKTRNVPIDLPVVDPAGENISTCGFPEENPEEPVRESLPYCKPIEKNLLESGEVETSFVELESDHNDPGLDICSKSVDEFPTQEAETKVDWEVKNRSKENPAQNETGCWM